MVVAAIIFYMVIIIKAFLDKYQSSRGGVNHSLEIAIVAMLYIYPLSKFTNHCSLNVPYNYIVTALLFAGHFLFLFNGVFNIIRRERFFFIGSPDANDSFTERFFRRIGTPATIALQIILPVVSTILYIIYFKRS